jgi:AraC-like DNA-binding protein
LPTTEEIVAAGDRKVFSFPIIRLSFFAMKERVPLPAGRDGAVSLFDNPLYVASPHRHSELECNLVMRGSCRYLVAERRYDLRPGSLIWLFPRQDHVLLERSRDLQMWILVFRPSVARRVALGPANQTLCKGDPPGNFCRRLPGPSTKRLGELFQEIAQMRRPARTDLFNSALAYALLLAWEHYRDADAQADAAGVHPAVERAARFIRDHPDPLKIDVLAEEAGLSPSHLSRLFKRQTGVPMVRYRARVCLNRFFALWGDGQNKKMLSTALAAGFGSYAQFHRVFKEHMQCGPAEYLRQ